MDSVEVDSDDDGKTWTVWSMFIGCRVARLATCANYSAALIYAADIGANIARDRHLLPRRELT